MTMPLVDFLKGTILDDLDEARQQEYFSQFRYQFQFCPQNPSNVQGEWARSFLRQLEAENLSTYCNQSISPKVYSYLLFIWKVFDLCTLPNQYDQKMIEHLWAHSMQVAYSKREKDKFLSETKKDLKKQAGKAGVSYVEQYVWPTLKTLPTLLFTILIYFGKTEIIKELIYFLYFSYQDKLQQLLDNSDCLENWLWNMAELIPYLLLKNFIPIHDTLELKDPRILSDFEATHLADHGTVSRVSQFFRNLFTVGEIKHFEKEEKIINECFADIYPVLLGNIEESLAQRKAEIMEVAKQQGRLQARTLLRTQHKKRLKIPTYIFKELDTTLAKI
jgi:hypothetical protein